MSRQKQKQNPFDTFYKAQAAKKPQSTLGFLKGGLAKSKVKPQPNQNPIQNLKQKQKVKLFPTKTSTVKPVTKAQKIKQSKAGAHLPRKHKIKAPTIKASKIKAPKSYKTPKTKVPKTKAPRVKAKGAKRK